MAADSAARRAPFLRRWARPSSPRLVLYYGAPVLVPVVEALVVWFVLNAMANGVRRVPLCRASTNAAVGVALVVLGARRLRDRLPDRAELDPYRHRAFAPQAAGFPRRRWTRLVNGPTGLPRACSRPTR